MNKRALLLLRSYGDFIVALTTYSRHAAESKDITVYASVHFQRLFDAISAYCDPELIRLPPVQFVDFGIRHHIFSLFTNRYLFSYESYTELKNVGLLLDRLVAENSQVWLEQKKRQWLFNLLTGRQTKFVHDGKNNIYKDYADFWGDGSSQQLMPVSENLKRELLLPGSRKPEKQLPASLVDMIRNRVISDGRSIMVAGLKREIKGYKEPVSFVDSFDELIAHIGNSDFIHCADSVSAHLCELLGKPHCVYYAKTINFPWITPHGRQSLYE